MSIAVLLSIKPEFAHAIFSGEKKYEYRKAIFKNRSVRKVYVYASAPISRVIGAFYVHEIIQQHPKLLWAKTNNGAGITEEYFNKYFSNRDIAYAISIEKTRLFDAPQELHGMFGIQTPPQSFRYVSSQHTDVI